MMMEVYPPPYPLQSTNALQLKEMLEELQLWVESQREWAEEVLSNTRGQAERWKSTASEDVVTPTGPELELDDCRLPITSDARLLQLPVTGLFASWKSLRELRERFDALVRTYDSSEETWESSECVRGRIGLLFNAVEILNLSLRSGEEVEAKIQAKEEQRMKLKMEAIKSALEGALKRASDQEEIDFDALFHPPEGETEE